MLPAFANPPPVDAGTGDAGAAPDDADDAAVRQRLGSAVIEGDDPDVDSQDTDSSKFPGTPARRRRVLRWLIGSAAALALGILGLGALRVVRLERAEFALRTPEQSLRQLGTLQQAFNVLTRIRRTARGKSPCAQARFSSRSSWLQVAKVWRRRAGENAAGLLVILHVQAKQPHEV